jgi:1-acyl-sn-glycerol-3-phosphate acyltransferase
VDEARIIPLHGDEPASRLRRARRLASRRTTRPRPGPGLDEVGASIHTLTPTALSDDETVSATTELAASPASVVQPSGPAWERRVSDGLAFVHRRLEGRYQVDEYGFDRDLTQNAVLPLLRPLYQKWFRVEVNGIEHIPAEGGALLVANHALAVHIEHPAGRFLRMLGADLIFNAPGLGSLARKTGSTLACTEDADRLLAAGELVGVWPEGFKGIGKPFRERYKLQRFGRGGFVHTAIRAGVPIIPVSIIGAEEIHPVLGNVKTLARLLNLPYFPITPTFPLLGPLGLIPLPSKWYIEFGAPIHTEDYDVDAADDPATVFDLTDRVRETIQSTLYRLLVQRRSVWR